MVLVLALAIGAAPFDYTGSLAPGQRLQIRNINGEVRLHDGDRVVIHATRHAERGDPNAVVVRVDPTRDGLAACVQYTEGPGSPCPADVHHHSGRSDDVQVDFDVTVPPGVRVDVDSINGSATIRHDGEVRLALVNGSADVEARSVPSARDVNGSLRLRLRQADAGALTAQTVNGSITLELPSGSGIKLDAQTMTGSISASGLGDGARNGMVGSRLSGTTGDGRLHVSLSTLNGSIRVR